MCIVKMVRRNYVIDDKLDKDFRNVVNKNWYKGKYSDSVNQAIKDWLKNQKKSMK